MPLRSVALFALTLSLTAQIRPTFDVASVRATDPLRPRTVPSGIRITAEHVSIVRMSLKQLIPTAFGTTADRIEGPGWSESVGTLNFDIEATIPPGTTPSQVQAMLRSLLEERFRLVTHPGTKVTDYYAVVVGKDGIKFAEVNDSPTDFSRFDWGTTSLGKGVSIFQSGSTRSREEPARISVEMSTLANVASQLYPHMGGVPVEDKTGLRGIYDIRLQYDIPDYAKGRAEGKPASELAAELRDQARSGVISGVEKLGLKIEKQHGEIETLVIDHLEKVPTDN